MRTAMTRAGLGILTAMVGVAPIAAQEFDIEEKCNQDFRVAMEYWRSRQIPDALELYTTVVEACPDFIEGFFYKGRCETALERYDEAVKSFRAGIAIDPKHKELRVSLAHALVQNGEIEDGIDVYGALIADDPTNVDYYNRLGHAAYQADRFLDAAMATSRAVEIRADSLALIKRLDYYFAKVDHPLARLQTSETMLLREPDNVSAMAYVGRTYASMDLHGRALPVYEQMWDLLWPSDGSEGIEYSASRARDMWLYGNALRGAKDYARALEAFERVLSHERYAKNASLLITTGFLCKDLNRYEKCIEFGQRALEIDPTNCGAMCVLGKGYEGLGENQEDVKAYDAAIQRYLDAKNQFELVVATGCSGPWARYLEYARDNITRMDERLKIARQKKTANG